MLVKFRRMAVCVSAVLAVTTNIATAAMVTFDVLGTFIAAPGIGLSGTFAVDEFFANFTDAELFVTGISTPFNIVFNGQVSASGEITVGDSSGDVLVAELSGNFLGGVITAGAICLAGDCSKIYATGLTGTFTPHLAATPVPTALPLFASGLGALGLIAYRRRRKGAALVVGSKVGI